MGKIKNYAAYEAYLLRDSFWATTNAFFKHSGIESIFIFFGALAVGAVDFVENGGDLTATGRSVEITLLTGILMGVFIFVGIFLFKLATAPYRIWRENDGQIPYSTVPKKIYALTDEEEFEKISESDTLKNQIDTLLIYHGLDPLQTESSDRQIKELTERKKKLDKEIETPRELGEAIRVNFGQASDLSLQGVEEQLQEKMQIFIDFVCKKSTAIVFGINSQNELYTIDKKTLSNNNIIENQNGGYDLKSKWIRSIMFKDLHVHHSDLEEFQREVKLKNFS
ncbi:MAG: hypothetical protein COB20_02755 [SAR86 cluster bacterium]|uniref:Uncharacterized protein n=1 Tax=SAR86 cluster bacterium TaxID=2030880 RepID=A0A2A4XDU7_9GAMM|nr:MAG: hypothetical protein COB20_02755 [SAR86 cluster bacterium]